MNIKVFKDKVEGFEGEIHHRAANELFQMLESNRTIVLEKMEEDNYNFLLQGFSDLAEDNRFHTDEWKSNYTKYFGLLKFYLDRIS